MQLKQPDTCSAQEPAAKGAMYLETKLKAEAKTAAQNTTS